MKRSAVRAAAIVALLALFAQLAGCATQTRQLPDMIALGRDKVEGPCIAQRGWKDPAVTDAFAYSYFVNCNRSATAKPQAVLRVVPDTPESLATVAKQLVCSDPKDAREIPTLAGKALVTRCRDNALGIETMRFDVQLGDQRLIASTSEALLGPVEVGMAILAGVPDSAPEPGEDVATTVQLRLASFEPPPAAAGGEEFAVSVAAAEIFDPDVALARGISFNRRGLHADASRVLNDALSRIPVDADPTLRVNLLLEAALADSNISFANSASEHFREARTLLAQVPKTDSDFLRRKQGTYEALDWINRRLFAKALDRLAKIDGVEADPGAKMPLRNLLAMRELNRASSGIGDASKAVAIPNSTELNELVLDAQGNWARSVALLSGGTDEDVRAANDALIKAVRAYDELRFSRVEPTAILWLGARIERQRARLAIKLKAWQDMRESFEASISMLKQYAALSVGTTTEPVIAETQLEYASALASLPGAKFEDVRSNYRAAVKAVIAARDVGMQLPAGIDLYFDGLVAEAEAGPLDDTYDNFFEAMQAAGEPAVARQLSQLKAIVSNNSDIAQAIRNRDDASREILRLSTAINQLPANASEQARKTLFDDRTKQEDALAAANSKLANDNRYESVNDRPATVKEVRDALVDDHEAFLKIVALDDRLFGILITKKVTHIYTIADTKTERREIEGDAISVRDSIDGRMRRHIDQDLDPYDVEDAKKLFDRIAGPEKARADLLAATALVIDPAGPLERLPVGALVISLDPLDPSAARANKYDFSQTDFLARRMTISTAVSPRSFLAARSIPKSHATWPFLGLGQHQPAVPDDSRGNVSVGFACSASYSELARRSERLTPIGTHELATAATALGVPGAPFVVDAAFNDQALIHRSDLAYYQVLHFATHGLEEGQWGCDKSPPALVTSFGGKGSDGLLSFSEIARLNLDANLVFLSACDTAAGVRDEALARASGQSEVGSTLEGLVRAFLAANARAVMATYWSVSAGPETDDLIGAFYRSARTGTIGGGLRDAQLKLMKSSEFSHPFYWAAYFVVGDSTKPLLTGVARERAKGR